MRVLGTAVFVLSVMVSAAAPAFAQSPSAPLAAAPLPSPGFVPPYEITRTVRAAGFDPLAPPLREGATYVLRATDFNGILMRVVVDARTGAIRDANRIVPGPGNYGSGGQFGMAAPDDAAPDILPEPSGLPPKFDAPVMAPAALPAAPAALQPPPKRHVKHVATPLPRARPVKLAVPKSEAAKSEAAKSEAAKSEAAKSEAAKSEAAKANSTSDHRQSLSSGADVAVPIVPAAKPGRTPSPAIND